MNNWNYEELGFKSQKEMEESIARVQRIKGMGEVEREIERRREVQSRVDSNGNIDLVGLEEGARLSELDRVVSSRLYEEREQAKEQARREEVQSLIRAAADDIKAEQEAEAQKELHKAKAEADEELQKEIYKKHNVKTDKEIETDNALGEMLKGLNI